MKTLTTKRILLSFLAFGILACLDPKKAGVSTSSSTSTPAATTPTTSVPATPAPAANCKTTNTCPLDFLTPELRFSKTADSSVNYQVDDGYGNINAQGIAVVGDINHDGFDDIAIGSPWRGQPNLQLLGQVQVVSGKDGSVLFTLDGEANNDLFGYNVAAAGDVDRDGTPDILISCFRGKVYIFSGTTHTILFRKIYDGVTTSSTFGYAIAGIGDYNHDGRPDFAVGDPTYTPNGDSNSLYVGRLWIFSGTGALIEILEGPSLTWNQFGFRLASDPLSGTVYVTSRSENKVYAYTYPHQPFIYEKPSSTTSFGTSLTTEDLDRDGVPELLVNGYNDLFVYSGATRKLLYSKPRSATPLGQFYSVAGVGDWNNDRWNDFAVSGDKGQTVVFSGKTGEALGVIKPEKNAEGWTIVANAKNYDGFDRGGLITSVEQFVFFDSSGGVDYSKSGGKVYFFRAP